MQQYLAFKNWEKTSYTGNIDGAFQTGKMHKDELQLDWLQNAIFHKNKVWTVKQWSL